MAQSTPSPIQPLGFEADLFKAADKLRGNMEPSDYKHVALGLIFLKYISDAFEADDSAGAIKIVMTGAASDPQAWQQHIGNKARRDLLATADTRTPCWRCPRRSRWRLHPTKPAKSGKRSVFSRRFVRRWSRAARALA